MAWEIINTGKGPGYTDKRLMSEFDVVITTHGNTASKPKTIRKRRRTRRSVVIKISEALMKKMGWRYGTRVVIPFDPQDMRLCVALAHKGAKKFSTITKGGAKLGEVFGELGVGVIKFTATGEGWDLDQYIYERCENELVPSIESIDTKKGEFILGLKVEDEDGEEESDELFPMATVRR